MTRDRILDALWLLLVGALSSAWCVTASSRLGATFDEPFYIAEGLNSWRSGSNQVLMRKGTMPLPVDAQTLPLYLWERQRGEPFDPVADLHQLLPTARLANLPFWWLLLFYGLRWGRVLGGPWAGRLSAGLLAADPNLLAHATLATTDIALTATVLVASYHWLTNRGERWPRRVLLPGVLYGVALAAKASALAFVPILWLVFGLCHLSQAGAFPPPRTGSAWGRVKAAWADTTRLRWDMVYAFWIGIVVLFAYCGCDWQPERSFVTWTHSLPDGPAKSALVPVSERLAIFSNAGEGLVQQVKHNVRGHHGGFVAGQWHRRAVWYYFPVALSIKLPDPTLALLVVLLLARPRMLLNPAGWAVLALLAFSLNARVQIGVRLVFPLVAFLIVALAVAVCRRKPLPRPLPEAGRGGREDSGSPSPLRGGGWGEGWTGRLTAALAVFCLAWSVLVAVSAWPGGLRYINRVWGGPSRGPDLLADSNYDWGQGLPELKAWMAANEPPPVYVWYYGGDWAVMRPPFRVLMIHQMPEVTPEKVKQAVGNGYLAVSVSLLSACPDRRPELLAIVDWLKTLEPVDRTPTFVIFRVKMKGFGR
ncbi:MAG TPA: hypothetical protein VFG68_01675 [Fimbriiglobus sp.]|nr:hypothetical protein [Fimbriiglobus sp.]